jgi:hypothetical protein
LVKALIAFVEHFHLYHVQSRPAGAWLLQKCWNTLGSWAQEPESLRALDWAEEDFDPPISGPTEFLRNISFQALTGLIISKPFAIPEMFRFEIPHWDQYSETWGEFTVRARAALDRELKVLRDQNEQLCRDYNLRDASGKTSDDHFIWLTRYQIQGWSLNKIAKEYHRTWPAVQEAVEGTAKLLIGPGWEYWLRPRKPGRPRHSS